MISQGLVAERCGASFTDHYLLSKKADAIQKDFSSPNCYKNA